LGIETIRWAGRSVRIIDQTKLPGELVYIDCKDVETLARCIEQMKIRGAPALGIAAAYGLVLGVLDAGSGAEFEKKVDVTLERLRRTRPTASNLFWALERMRSVAVANRQEEPHRIRELLLEEANLIFEEDRKVCQQIGNNGAVLLRDGMSVLTHCNAGALATGGYGTALGIVYAAKDQGKRIHVFADETRPLLQGARLTAWELMRKGVEVTLICDNAAGSLMRRGGVDCVIVGADRIAGNGDVANKVGTYGLAVLAKQNGIPFYVAAPISTLDMELSDGDQIPIEERAPDEVTRGFGLQTAPEGVKVRNPAFDVTPHELITAIVSEEGIARQPYAPILKQWAEKGNAEDRARKIGRV